ncbi:fimbrial family protein [Paraburkholderia xenovorans LB400]|uniref:Fimbrial protein n=1 Tax=Paraburkholderia xenovorans (strain LB400) TaxID=266265 RepID=Q13FX1_PARXL|nr:fimbrial protein [Paraburkholderia xenovorans]ABE37018.1 Putative fimbrial protein [Paraburkholderia xenovorans LB400]AIP34726.1 fimbrial family protein [Paraburkholderia xenovorans LB400]
MNKKYAMTVLGALAAATMALSSSAQASDGVITFNGKVVDQTCNVAVNGGPATSTVTLPTVATGLLVNSQTAGDTDFTVAVSGCTGAARPAAVRTFFEAGPTLDTANDYTLLNTAGTPAKNVRVQLAYADGSGLKVGDSSQHSATAVATDSGGATMHYIARYYKVGSGAPGAGDVTSSVTYSIEYVL